MRTISFLLPFCFLGACGDGDGASSDTGVGSGADASTTTSDGAAGDAALAADGGTADGAAPATDAVTPLADAASTIDGNSMQLTLLKAAWAGTYQAYVQATLPALIMVAGKAPPATVEVRVEQKCPEAGMTTLEGPAMTDTMRNTVTDYSFIYGGCKFNGLTIDGTLKIKASTNALTGGSETYAGDLTYSGFFARTCTISVKRNITTTGSTFEGTVCGEDVTKW